MADCEEILAFTIMLATGCLVTPVERAKNFTTRENVTFTVWIRVYLPEYLINPVDTVLTINHGFTAIEKGIRGLYSLLQIV